MPKGGKIMSISPRSRRLAAGAIALALVAPSVASVAAGNLGGAQIVRNAACNEGKENNASEGDQDTSVTCTAKELTGFVKAAEALVDPAIVAMAAIAPMACIVGAGSMMFGGRRGLMIIGYALGTLVFVVSIKGIVY
jgi:hypothetical protein